MKSNTYINIIITNYEKKLKKVLLKNKFKTTCVKYLNIYINLFNLKKSILKTRQQNNNYKIR